MQILNRRQVLMVGAGAAALGIVGLEVNPAAAENKADELIKAFTGGAAPQEGRVTITAPEIAENGNTVPVSFGVESAMSGDDVVDSVLLVAEGNPNPKVATFSFSSMSGEAGAATRIRMAKTQNITAVAKMKDGSFYMGTKTVKVTIGGCGG